MRAVLLSLLLLVGACASADDGTETTVTVIGGQDEPRLLLRVDSEGGFAMPSFLVGRLPLYAVYTDGRLFVEGPTIDVFPGPATPNQLVGQLPDDALAAIINAIESTDLANVATLELIDNRQFVADATDTVFRYYDEAGEHKVLIYALGLEAQPIPEHNPYQNLLNVLDGATRSIDPIPYDSTALELWSGQGPRLDDPDVRSWPVDEAVLTAGAGPAFDCQVVEGAAHDLILESLATATRLTVWEQGERQFEIVVRPLLPDESGCSKT